MISCLYTCEFCGTQDAPFEVRERGPDEDVVRWMKEAVTPAVGAAHFGRSPFCRAATITTIKIPLDPGGGRVGDPTKH